MQSNGRMMVKKVFPAGLFGFMVTPCVVVALIACAEDPRQGLSASCEVDTDCTGTLVCVDGHCGLLPDCQEGTCPKGQVCVDENCWPKDCDLRNCPGLGDICVDEECLPADCLDVTCPPGQRCAAGRCYPIDCPTKTCEGYGQVCLADTCTERSCVELACPAGQRCANGRCYPTTCQQGCASDEVCIDDVCVSAACAEIVCQEPLICRDGWCVQPGCTTSCDDHNPCTDDQCVDGECRHETNKASCDDGVFCNGADVCVLGVCTHAGDPCFGGPECADTCHEASGDCLVSTGTPCTDDGDPCTRDLCDDQGACAHPDLPDGTECGGAGFRCCAGDCVDTSTSTAHCGGCDKPCNLNRVDVHACSSGECQVVECIDDWGNCDEQHSNGCEQSLLALGHCGSCYNHCGAGETCDGVACRCAGGPGCSPVQYCYTGTPNSGCHDLPTIERDPTCSDMGVIHQAPDFFARFRVYARPYSTAIKYGLHESCLSQGAVVFELPDSPLSIDGSGFYEKTGYLDNPVACSPDHVDLGHWTHWVVVDGYESNHVSVTYYNSSCIGSGYVSCGPASNYCPPDFHNGK